MSYSSARQLVLPPFNTIRVMSSTEDNGVSRLSVTTNVGELTAYTSHLAVPNGCLETLLNSLVDVINANRSLEGKEPLSLCEGYCPSEYDE